MIPIYKPYLSKENLKFAHQAIDSGWISSQGEFLDFTKNELKNILGCKKIILTNNGTTATHLLSLALKFKYPNIKKIIVPNNVYVAAWNSFIYDKNYELIPIDADLETWNFDITKLEKHINDETAILIVHNIGNIINVPMLKQKFPNTIFLEDNCEGFLGEYNNSKSGTESFVSSISFYGNKTLTSGEGGAFITNDDDVFDYINTLKNQGQSQIKFNHSILGYNYRMTNIQAALLYGQLMDLNFILDNKKRVFEEYKKNLQSVEQIVFQKEEKNTKHSNWMFGIRFINFDINEKKSVEHHLFESGIETRPMFYPINTHRYLNHIDCDIKNATTLNHQCLILPSYPELTKSQIFYICEKIKKFLIG
jgi:perosamine synthetase